MIKMLILGLLLSISLYSNSFKKQSLIVCSGAGLIKPMNEIIKNFENDTNIKINIHYGGSGELFATLSTTGCDVFIPGAFFYIKMAEKKNLIDRKNIETIAKHIPVFVVQKGNPKNIYSLEGLVKPNLKIAIGDPKSVAIGRVAVKMLKNIKIFKKVKKNISVYAGTVNQLLIYMAMNQVDVAIIWEDMLTWTKNKGKLEIIPIPKNENIIKTIPSAIGSMSNNKKAAEEFNKYLINKKSKNIWIKWGFKL